MALEIVTMAKNELDATNSNKLFLWPKQTLHANQMLLFFDQLIINECF